MSVQKMMHKLNINDEIYTISQSATSNLIKEQSFNYCQQQHQHDRSRFFYHLRQKRKQRRLQQDPYYACSHGHQHSPEMKISHVEQKRKPQLITAIVGSSLARNISLRNIENETNEVRLRFRSGSDCAEALAWLQSIDGQFFMRGVDQLIFIIGTNDIHRVGACQTVQRIDQTIERVRCMYPNVKIVWQLLQQRTRKTWLLPEGQAVLNEIQKCNLFLLELAAKRKFDTIQPAIPIRYMYDGLHPSKYGVEMMEATIRNQLQKVTMVYSSSYPTVSPCCPNSMYPQPLMSIHFKNPSYRSFE